jgi:hypothetical protein
MNFEVICKKNSIVYCFTNQIRNRTVRTYTGVLHNYKFVFLFFFIFIVAPCILKIHLLSHNNKYTNYVIYYLKSV